MSKIKVFFSYSHLDEIMRDDLATHLSMLERERVIESWHDRQIPAGSQMETQIDSHFIESQIILLLISPDFLASDYCYKVEMKHALERHKKKDAIVIPVILRPCDWCHGMLSKLKALPKDGKAVSTWDNKDEAFLDVARDIRKLAKKYNSQAQGCSQDDSPPHKHFVRKGSRSSESYYLKLVDIRSDKIVGRQDDFNEIKQLVFKNQLVVISGPPGVGKTTIGASLFNYLEEKEEYVIWYDAEISPSEPSICSCINKNIEGDWHEKEDILDGLTKLSCKKTIYIFVDNFESILRRDNKEVLVYQESKDNFIRILIELSSIATIIILSRISPVNIPGETNYHLPGIDKRFYVSLFKQYLTGSLTMSDKDMINKICRHLNGNPLAIKIAAPLVSRYGYSLASLYKELRERGPDVLVISDFSHELGIGAKNFSASVDLSYNLLSESSKYLFMILSVWKGPFDFEILNNIVGKNIEKKDFYNLIDLNLVESVEWGNRSEFKIVPLLGQFSSKKFEFFCQDNGMGYAHELHNKCMFLHKWGKRHGQGWTAASATIDINNLNVFALNAYESLSCAISNNQHEDMLLVWETFWRILELFIEPRELSAIGKSILHYALKIEHYQACAWTLINSQGYSLLIIGELAPAQKGLEEGIKIGKECGEHECVSIGWRHLARIAIYKKKYKVAESYYMQSLATSELLQEPEKSRHIASTYVGLARVYLEQNQLEFVELYSNQAIKIFRKINDLSRLSSALLGLGSCYLEKFKINRTFFKKAENNLLEAASFRRRETKGQALLCLAELYWINDDNERAKEFVQKAVKILQSISALELEKAKQLEVIIRET